MAQASRRSPCRSTALPTLWYSCVPLYIYRVRALYIFQLCLKHGASYGAQENLKAGNRVILYMLPVNRMLQTYRKWLGGDAFVSRSSSRCRRVFLTGFLFHTMYRMLPSSVNSSPASGPHNPICLVPFLQFDATVRTVPFCTSSRYFHNTNAFKMEPFFLALCKD